MEKINKARLASQVARDEGGKVSISVAQVSEVIHLYNLELKEYLGRHSQEFDAARKEVIASILRTR